MTMNNDIDEYVNFVHCGFSFDAIYKQQKFKISSENIFLSKYIYYWAIIMTFSPN